MQKYKMPFVIYVVLTFLGAILWLISVNELYHFCGASSLIYSFLLFVSAERAWSSLIALIWFPSIFFSMIVTFFILCLKNVFRPMLFVIGADLCFSLFCLVYKCVFGNYYGLFIILLGLVARGAYFVFLIHCAKKAKTMVRYDLTA